MAPLVQLDRMYVDGADGRRIESCTGWYENDPIQKDKSESCGAGGHRSRYLSHAKRALYHLSYSPMPHFWKTCCHIIYANFFVFICFVGNSCLIEDHKIWPFDLQIDTLPKLRNSNRVGFSSSCGNLKFWGIVDFGAR